ncbi:Peptidoglycan/LPS O-acetylase OafA/YrhL, contains acyltransferase and SGNH-hydrolase domains [Tistlia consotensis]|uniref:Peptidoglycan/LPS O-acetylase OafA/YrhL, contains acyltransferase and SGNH-hydrolase domains n=1 Tax=Tistlia consotensis USBA 355 TaxID=560819 RepID=A0A1Y6BFC0_9PROT|nr:Peptidoglycan/LPS O-acetylase OafA/YrhL, contains acyltransferase and SGNH-hydrolase domains [Tistlia consotensis USBA 355]SNR35585.1 Peptidoglycan/LPS O-acetylase OafA/YrhL, contains acyltransferase and SGNH-hydrolase domains [Tistlia consotensis]
MASVIVILHHFFLAFYPSVKAPVSSGGLKFTPLYLFMNGEGVVAFFFVLSGFVLTVKLHQGFSLEALLSSIVKRLPRLAVPVGASVILGFLVLRFTGDQYALAASLNRSAWLQSFGNAHFPLSFEPSLPDALRQSLVVFLRPYDFYYNSNLWTMGPEFYGSMVAFLIVALTGLFKARRGLLAAVAHGGLVIAFLVFFPPLVPFFAGSYLAFLWANRKTALEISAAPTMALLIGGALGLSFANWVVNTLASLSFMIALLGNRALAGHLSGRLAALLGMLSFPLYLVHAPVILSASSFVYVQLSAAGAPDPAVGLLTLAATLLASGLVCIPFVFLDSSWAGWLNAAVRRLVGSVLAACRNRAAAHPTR